MFIGYIIRADVTLIQTLMDSCMLYAYNVDVLISNGGTKMAARSHLCDSQKATGNAINFTSETLSNLFLTSAFRSSGFLLLSFSLSVNGAAIYSD